MVDFFVVAARVFAAFWRTLRREREARALIIFVIIILASGTFFFMETEHWSIVASLYYCVLTLTTVGTGELVPHSDIGRIFTILYLFLGVGAMLAALQLIAKHAVAQAEGPAAFVGRIQKRSTKK